MSTQAYYKERLGFDPQEVMQDGVNGGAYYEGPHPSKRHRGESADTHDQVYEENLTKFKDERDAIQKKTFTKWVNKHLKKVNRHVNDLFEDLRDGLNLISLLEVLSGEHLPRERGRMRFHMLQNVQMALDFLRYKKIKLVNIRAEDIVDGNPKLTLGLIWTIILHFQGTLESDDTKPLKSSLKKSSPSPVGSPITTSLNLASVPRSLREGLTRHETVYDGNYPGMERSSSYRSGSYREESYNGRIVHDGNQTHFEYDGESALAVPTSAGGLGMSELQAIHTNKRMSTEVLGSSLESTKISKKDDVSGQRRITTRIVRKVTTLTRGEEKASAEDVRGGSVHRSAEHYRHVEMESSLPRKVKISDIVIGQEANVTAREALLSWARRSTAKYPGVRVADFTSSWRDGLAFNALIHRNRPDLIDWRNIRSRQVRERLETAFHVVEKEYGVTRLLDPEDVDTHEPDEKSLITYISSLYETFPEPPAVHPLFDAESQRRAAAYTEQAAQHRAWLHEKCALMQDRAFPSTLIEMKKLLSESTRFRQEEVPLRQREKQKLFHHYRELEKYFESVGECDIEPMLRPDALEQAWSRLLMAQQERERDLTDEIRRLERLQRLAEKLHRDIKQTEGGLDSVERHIESEIRRVERGVHPADAKLAAEQIEQELRAMEHTIQEMFQDSHALRDGRYPQAADLHRRVQQVHDRWLNARQSFTGRLVPRLSSVRMPVQQTTVRRETRTVLETRVHDADPKFQQLSEATRWCKERLKKLHESDYGSDLPSVQHELDKHQREHKQIDQFHSKVEQCVHNRSNFSGEELNLYNQHLSQLQKLYAELLSTSTKRMSDLDALQDFLQSATAELNWLNEKEQVELSRDWADPHINLPAVQHYYEQLMSSLEKRELQFSNVIDRGEALIAQHHPATKTIESHLQVMQSQWAWVLQLTLCLETHLKHTTQYHNFFEEVKEAEKWIQKREEALNTTFSQSEFTLDQGERLLKGMQELREELNSHGGLVSRLVEDAQEIRPVKQRRAPITRPIRAETVCAYKHANMSIEKGSAVTVVDNSGRSRWRVRLGGAGTDVQLPGAVLALPPPCHDAVDAAARLRSAYDRVIQLWQRKQLRMRQNMIFATIKVVKGWDFPQFVAMGAEQRQAIRRALNEDAEKLLAEGDPADPQLRRLRREIDDVNRLFDEFERRARAEEESKNAARIFTEQSSNLLERLDVLERQLHERIASHIPRDLDTLEHLVLQHKDWETSVHALNSDVEEVQATFRGIALKTPAMKKSLDKVMGKWNDMQSKSQLFVERLKFVEIVVNSMEENHQTISEFEIKLAQFNDLPNDVELLKDMHEDLLRMQVAVSKQQIQVDQMNDDAENCRRLVETSRAGLPHSSLPRAGKHIDLERLDKEVSQLNNRWNNVCSQLAERLRSCEAAYQLLRNYSAGLEKEAEWIDDAYSKLQAQPPIEVKPREHFEPTRNLLTTVVERTPKIEKVNVDGGRYIREAKIYSSRCQRYAEWLCDEVHPSLDMRQLRRQADIELAERFRARGRSDPERIPSGSEAVARELDDLNANYQRLMDMLYERLRRIAAANPGDIVTLRLVEAMAPRSARSFRQEFNMQDLTTEHTYTSHYTTEKYVRTSHSTELDGQPVVKSMTNGKLNSPNYTTKTIITEDDRPDVRKLKRVHRMYEGPNIIESKGILHPETREILTVGQAISMRILDVRTGRLLSAPDTRQTMTIEQAAQEGLIDPKLAARLTGPCGMTEDGNEVTLLEAIQRELYDAEQGLSDPAEKRIKVTVEGEQSSQGMSISDALNRGQVDLQRGLYRLPNGSYITIAEAYQRGYLIYNEIIKIKSSALCLSDAISQDLVDNSGWILDRNSGDRYQIDVAIQNELINPNIREVVDPKNDTKITLAEAIEKNIINTKHSKYIHTVTKEKLTFKDAAIKRYICKPMTLKDVCDNNLMTNDGKILSPANRAPLNILEAISAGVLDSDNVKCITNTTTGGLLTLSEALGAKIILHDNKFRDNLTGEICTIPEAVDRGLITSVSQRSIFDIDGFKDPKTGEFVSFNIALSKGNLKYVNGETFLKSETGDWVFLEDCTKVSLVRAEVLEMFNRKIGVYENGKELSVLDAVFKNVLDPKTGHLLDSTTKRPIPFNKAVEINMITPEGAALLNSLLNITLTLQTVTKTVKRYVTVTNTSGTQRSETIITFAEAIRRGLIDENTQTFTDPTTGTVFPIQQALDEGLVGVEKNEPRVVHISDRVSKKDLVPGQVVELKITKKSYIKDLPPSPEGKVQRDSSRPETVKSPDFAIHEMQPREGMVQEIRTITSKSVVSEPTVTSMTIKKNTIELPRGGWTLKEAIQQNLFDPTTGMFIIPGTDRVLDLEEAIKINIVNGDSANVVDPKSRKEVPLYRALESRIIDSTGHYKHKTEIITMKEAIERRFITFIQLTSTTHSQKVITITSVAGMPDKMEISEMYDTPSHETISEDQSALEPVQVTAGVIFDPATALVISTSSGVSENVLEAVDRGILPANSVKVIEPQTGRPISLKQAVDHGIVNPKTGEYTDKTGKRITLVDAAKIGLVAVVGAPLVAASKVIQVVKSTMVVDPQTGENLPMEVAYERGLVDPITYKKYEESIRDRTPDMEVTEEVKSSSTSIVTYSQVTTTKTLPSETTITVVVDPKTGEKLPIEVAYERGLIDPVSYKKYELSIKEKSPDYEQRVISSPSSSGVTFTQVSSVTTPDKMVTMVVDPKTGEQLPIEVAYERGIVDPITYKIYQDALAIKQQELQPVTGKTVQGTSTVTISQVSKPVSVGAAVSEGFITVESIQNSLSADNRRVIESTTTTDKTKTKPTDVVQIIKSTISTKPKYKVNIGREQTPEAQVLEKPVVLQKLRKHVVTPLEAVEQGLVDKETAKILESVRVYKDESGSPITLEIAIEKGIIDENKGKIVDPVRGDVLTIKEAIKRGILDIEGQDEVLIPLARSLTIPEVLEQGLLDPVTGKIVHPETGSLLTLREAIICDIVDPLSSITLAPGKKITLAEAVERNIIDNDKNVVKTTDGPLDFVSAVNAQVFSDSEIKPIIDIPPAAMTLNIAIKKNLINPHTGEMKHPLTGEMTPVGDAVKKDLIMAIPYPQTSETITLEEALDKGAVNLKQATFTDPKSKEVIPLDKALEKGLLAIKPMTDMQATGIITTTTETFTSQHTVTTKMIELLADYVLVSSNEVQNTKTGEIISIDEARRQGIIRDEQTSKEQFTTNDTNFSFEDALNLGYINIETGTFTHPKTGETVTISEAVTTGLLNTEVPSESGKSSPKKQVLEMLDLNEAFELLFDEKTQKFRDPKSPNKVLTFKEALDKKIINPDSVIYNVEAGKPVTLKEALNSGLIDKKTGKLKEPKTGKSLDIKNAAKMGLIAVVAAPVLAGMAVVQGAKSVTSKIMQPKQEKAVESSSRIVTSEKTTVYEPVGHDKDKKSSDKDKRPIDSDVHKPGKVDDKPQKSSPQTPTATEQAPITVSKTVTVTKKPDAYDIQEELVSSQDTTVTENVVVEKTTIVTSKDEKPEDERLKQKPKSIKEVKPDQPSTDVVTEQTTVTEVLKKPKELVPKDVDTTKGKHIAEKPSPTVDMEHVVFEEKPVIQEFTERTAEGEEVVTVTKTTVTKTIYDTAEEAVPSDKQDQSPTSLSQPGKERTPTSESKTVVQEKTTVVTSAPEQTTVKPADIQTLPSQRLEDLSSKPGYSFTKFDDGPTIEEIHEVTPDGKEITRIVKTTVSKSEPTEFITEHSSTVITSSSSTFTTVEITQNESSSYQVVTEETSGPQDYTETVIQEYQVTEAPDEPDDVQATRQYKVSPPSEKEEGTDKDSALPKGKLPTDKVKEVTEPKEKPAKIQKDLEPEKPVELAPGVIYDPNTSVVISAKEGVADNLLEAVNKGIVPAETVKVIEPKTGKEIALKDAIKKGVVDSKTGEVKDKSGKKISIGDAAKIGLIAVVGAPILAAAKVVQVVKNAVVVDPKTGEKLPLDEAREKGLVDPDTYKKYEQLIKTTTPEEITTVSYDVTTTQGPTEVTYTETIIQHGTVTTTHTIQELSSQTTESPTTVISEITTSTVPEQKMIGVGKTTPIITVNDGKSVSAMLIDAERQPLRVIEEITEQNVTKEKSEPIKPLYENIQLIDAIAQGKIEPKVCRIIINGVESPLTVQDSLEQEQISRFAPVDVISKNCVVVKELKPSYSVAISQRLTPEELSEMGVYDIEKQVFLNPETGAKITFEELVYGLQIFDPETLLVKDLGSKSDDYISFDEAIARPIIDKTTGHMVNPKTGKRVPFLECVQLGWIVEKPEDVSIPEQVTIESALEQGLYNAKTGEIKDVNTGALVPIGQAIEKGLVDQESLLIKVPRSNEIISLSDAIERNIIEIHEGVITIVETREIIEISVAIQRGFITVIRRPISIEAVIENDMYEPKTGKIKDKVTEQLVSVGDAVDRNIVHPTISEIKDTALEKFVPLSEALDTKLIDPETGKIKDKKTGKDIPLDDALKKGLVATKAVTFSLFDIIELGYYSPETGKVMNPRTGQFITLKEAIQDKLVDPSEVKIKDDKSEAVVPFDKAVKSGLIDLEKGVITSPLCNLKDACDKGYLLSDKKPWSLQEGLVQGFYDPETGLLTINDVTMTLEDAIKIGNINPEALTVRNSVTGEIISLADAIKVGIVDSKEGKVRDPIYGDKISLTDASERGLIVPAKRKLSLPEAVFKGFYDPKTGKFSNPLSKEKIPTDRAIKKRLIDPQSTLVHAAGKVIPFEFAVDRGIVDSRTGTIRLGDENIDFREAFERGILVEVRKPMSLIEALEKGVYNEITGLFMDPQSGKKYTLVEAIKMGLVDAHSVHILDNRLGKWDKITLPESLETGVIDDQTGKIRNINSDNEEISLRKAFEIGLLVDSKAPISLQRALHQGLYDDSTGKIIDPATNRKITLHEAIRRSIISPKYLCYFDKKSEKPLSLGDCCRSEIIDRRSGKFHEPGSDVAISLSEAMSLGLIVDIESAGFTLYEALAMNMYSINELAFIHPVSERPITLKTAIAEELINPETSLVKHIPSSKYIKLTEAIESGIIDDENSIYILPNGNQINLLDAKHRGLIVTTKKNLSLEEIIRNGLFRADNGKIVDPSTNEFIDINKAIEINLLNPDLTVVKDNFTNKFKPLPNAIQQGDVDVSKGRVIDTKAKKTYSLDIAFDKGLLVTVIQPITSQTAKKHVAESLASKEPTLREFTLDEAIKYEFIDPETAVIKDPHKNKYIPLKLGITEGIIDKNAKGSFDTQNRSRTLCFVFENGLIVYVREPLTFEQAIEEGHLNVATARFTDPHSNEVLTIRDAAALGYIDPDTALIKDNLKKRLVKLPEAFRKGLMDAEKGNILDTETSKLNTLTAAIESGLLMTPKKSFSLIETLNFGIYNPTTGALNDPFITTSVMDRKRLNLGEAIAQGIVDPSSTVVKEPETGKIMPLVQAMEQKLVDPVEGRLTIDPVKSISLDLVKALKKGYLLPAETRPLPAMLKNPFELNRECLPVRDHINDDIKNHHRFAKYLTSHSHCAKNLRSRWWVRGAHSTYQLHYVRFH
ncbi:hypothetical protein B5X24_HaOG210326 [Helicoverpa armigera]|uniref:Calponin-homology (CH) domain-containing protein n=1 Tax=Helicoverpa armigera TaxID=29058 RepID=A0A2W1BGZ7_HELAM|nr:hypothetical protein B5X24_HaOG210326 [Helicoverpa armigera]